MTALTIVMPSFNQGQFIEDAVTSVLNNVPKNENIEFIIKDNCSDDATKKYLSRLVNDTRITIIIEKDKGQSDALSSAFSKAKGEILCWLNSDDVLLEGALSTVIDYFQKNRKTDVLYGKALFMNKDGVVTNIYPTGAYKPSLLMNTCYISQPSVFFRRNIYKKVNGINAGLKYCLDYDLWVRFTLANATFSYIPQYLSLTREYQETKTAMGGMAFVEEIITMLNGNVGYVPPAWVLYKKYEQLKRISKAPKHWLYFKAWCWFLLKYKGDTREASIVLKHHFSKRIINSVKVLRLRGKHFSQLLINNKV